MCRRLSDEQLELVDEQLRSAEPFKLDPKAHRDLITEPEGDSEEPDSLEMASSE